MSQDDEGNCPFCEAINKPFDSPELTANEIARRWKKCREITAEMLELAKKHPGGPVQWKCGVNPVHQWRTKLIDQGEAKEHSCPFCASESASTNIKLSERFPEIAALWCLTGKDNLRLFDDKKASSKKFWRTCGVCRNKWFQ